MSRLIFDLDVFNQGKRQFAVTDQILTAAILGEVDGFTGCVEHMP